MEILIFLGYFLLAILALVIGFLILIPVGSWLPVNRGYKPVEEGGIDVFVSTNGVHVDFILPTQNHLFDWSKVVDSHPFKQDITDYSYLGLGWGDPGFYLEIATWDELTLSIAARALLYPTSTIMHITGYHELPYETQRVEKLSITPSQYLKLCSFIYSDFVLREDQSLDWIPGISFSEDDSFYMAHGKYHAFHTCNYWINKGLKRIGVRTSLWSPLDRGIFYQIDKIKEAYEDGFTPTPQPIKAS